MNLDRSAWKRVALGDVADASKEKVDPTDGTVSRYVAGEHMDTGDLKIHRWGEVGEGYLGPAFHRRFKPGQVLYGSRRTYLRKVAVADFDGVCANTTFVVQSKDEQRLLPEFLPWVMTSERFHAFAIAESKGSVNPYVNWSDIARYEFDLPPVDEQMRIANLLWVAERHHRALTTEQRALTDAAAIWTDLALDRLGSDMAIRDVVSSSRPICYGVVQPGQESESGIPLLRVLDLEGDGPRMERLKRVSEDVDRQYRRSKVEAGDVLVSIVGTIGRCWAVEPEFEGANIARALARLAPNPDIVRSDYLLWVLTSLRYQGILTTAAFESARKTLNLSALADLRIPVPSLSEQDELIQQHVTSREALALLRCEREAIRGVQGALLREVGDVA